LKTIDLRESSGGRSADRFADVIEPQGMEAMDLASLAYDSSLTEL
jgi:hypothetical protein